MTTTFYSTSGSTSISGNITIDGYGIPVPAKTAELPPITMSAEDEHGHPVTMTMAPEGNISTGDLTKILMLVVAIIGGRGSSINPLSYVKKHNLERHFTYS